MDHFLNPSCSSFLILILSNRFFYFNLSTVSLNISLPGFMDIFDTDLTTVQWLMTGFTFATGIIAPLCGYLGNCFGTRKLFLLSVAGLMTLTLRSF
ncbi:MFS transporter [Peribacillus simplex]|uniref:MFS transporter n=1 Tax=Peribacillus simplex TaxID=1478 RepID=UPI0037F82254